MLAGLTYVLLIWVSFLVGLGPDLDGSRMRPRTRSAPGGASRPAPVFLPRPSQQPGGRSMAASRGGVMPGPSPQDEARDALAHLYDPGRLQAHPWAGVAGGGKALRAALEDAVDALKPAREGKA